MFHTSLILFRLRGTRQKNEREYKDKMETISRRDKLKKRRRRKDATKKMTRQEKQERQER